MSMSTPTPLVGRLVPLRTKDEVRASLETHDVYVIEVPAKFANVIKDVVQAAVPDFKTSEISHLRRVVQFKFLPAYLQKLLHPPARLPRGDENNPASTVLLSAPSPSLPSDPSPPSSPSADDSSETTAGDDVNEEVDLVRYFVLCPTRYIQHSSLMTIIRQCPPFEGKNTSPRVITVTVPALAPTSAEQAALWSDQFWPISYKNTNPYGPHPSLVQRNADEIKAEAGTWLALAKTAGKQISCACLGEEIGVVVVDVNKAVPEVIAVAGDSRWRSPTGTAETPTGTGNVMAHAVHRAIAMVAKKRLRAAGTDPALLDRSLFCDIPLTEIEKQYYDKDNTASSGYLCVDLDIYLTHEPCLMCSMAILHSRFRRCIFIKRMPLTGGMTSDNVGITESSEGGLKHGLFWRPSELNWKFLAWEFREEGEESNEDGEMIRTLHV